MSHLDIKEFVAHLRICTTTHAVCCSVLQCVAVWCSASSDRSYEDDYACSVLQCVAVCCSVLQCVAVCCSVLQCIYGQVLQRRLQMQCVVVCCSALQCICGSALERRLRMQFVAVAPVANCGDCDRVTNRRHE